MTAIVTIEDGRHLHRSNVGIQGMLWLISEAMPPQALRLKRWLADVANRPSGYNDVELNGLEPADRETFWQAARAAWTMLERKHGTDLLARPNAWSARCLCELLLMHDDPALNSSARWAQDHEPAKVDLDDLWDAPAAD